MKVSELKRTLDNISTIIDDLKDNSDLKLLIGNYNKLENNSGYFFSNYTPIQILNILDDMRADIQMILQDIDSKIDDQVKEMEL